MFTNLRKDYRRLASYRERSTTPFLLECLLFDNGFQAVVLFRVARWFKVHRIPVLGALSARLSILTTGVDINPNAKLGPGLVISHGIGLVVGGSVVAGGNLLLHHQVTLGAPTPNRIAQMPQVGDDVSIGAGATIIGGVQVGDGAFIGAQTLVTTDVPAHCKVSAPATPVDTPVPTRSCEGSADSSPR